MITLADVLQGAAGARLAGPVEGTITFAGVTNDSRAVGAGDLFVALRGERDGHAFVPDACRRGAAGALVERPIDPSLLDAPAPNSFAQVVVPDTLLALQQVASSWLRRHDVPVIAVTGSVGKTTTKELIATVLSRRFFVLKNERNLNNEIGLPLSVLRLSSDHRRLVLEMGMYALGEIAQLCRIAPPSIGVVTNVGPSHLERLGTLERIAQAKSELVAALPAGGRAILNGDDPRVAAMVDIAKSPVILYGLGAHCDLRAVDLRSHGFQGISFDAVYRDRTVRLTSPMPGRHSVYACLAATAVAICEGLTWLEIAAGLAAGAAAARFVTVPGRNGSTIIDDTYNASPASTAAALDLLGELPGRRIAILGDMFELGSFEEQGHRAVGEQAALTVHRLICVGKRSVLTAESALNAGLRDVVSVPDKGDVEFSPERGDYILVKGSRGMRMEEIVERLRAREVTT